MRNEPLPNKPLIRWILLVSVFALPRVAFGAPGDILFSDNFERANLAPWTAPGGPQTGISTGPQVSNSPTRGAYTRSRAVAITSPSIAAAVPAAQVSFWVRRGSDLFSEYPDSNEDLAIEYRRADNSWGSLANYPGGVSPGQIFVESTTLPLDALHGSLAIRVRQTGGSGGSFDWWHFDDLVITEIAPPPILALGTCDNFESGLGGNWSINQFSGFAGTSAETYQSPFFSMFLNGGTVDVTSSAIDTSDPAFSDISLWLQRGSDVFSEDPDPGENLVVEYLDDGGSWVVLETFAGSGTDGQSYLRAYNIPANGHHAGFRMRFRQTGGSGAPWDYWHIDDVCLNLTPLPDLLVTKSVQVVSDPFNIGSNPKSIPGATMLYTISVSNQGPGIVDNDSLAITDAVPANSAVFVDTSGGDPIVFADDTTASGLAYSFATAVSFSNQVGGGPPYNYSPVPDAQGYDPVVTGYRINPNGVMSAASGSNFPGFSVQLRIRVQ